MILFVDVEKNMLKLYGEKGLQNIPFSEVSFLEDYIGKENILYVTNATEVNADDVKKLICSITGQTVKEMEDISNNYYIHSTVNETIVIPDINVKFEGSTDCKLLDNEMKKMIENSPLLMSLIKSNKIRIIKEGEKRHLDREKRKLRKKFVEKQKLSDAQLDTILVDSKKSAVDMAADGISSNDDIAEEMDLTNEREGQTNANPLYPNEEMEPLL